MACAARIREASRACTCNRRRSISVKIVPEAATHSSLRRQGFNIFTLTPALSFSSPTSRLQSFLWPGSPVRLRVACALCRCDRPGRAYCRFCECINFQQHTRHRHTPNSQAAKSQDHERLTCSFSRQAQALCLWALLLHLHVLPWLPCCCHPDHRREACLYPRRARPPCSRGLELQCDLQLYPEMTDSSSCVRACAHRQIKKRQPVG